MLSAMNHYTLDKGNKSNQKTLWITCYAELHTLHKWKAMDKDLFRTKGKAMGKANDQQQH